MDKALTELERLAYTAGLVDGEGYVGINRTKSGQSCSARVLIGNTNEDICQWLQGQYGGSIWARGNQGDPRRKPSWIWYLSGIHAKQFLLLMLPYLRIKRAQAEIVVRFFNKPQGGPRRHGEAALSDEEQAAREHDLRCLRDLNMKGPRG